MKYLHRFWIALGVACLPVAAQAEASGFPGVDDPKLAKAIDEAMERPKPRFCEELAPLWAEAAQRSKAPNDNLMVMSANAMIMCAVEKERFEDASNLIIRTEAKFGQQVFFHRLALALHSHLRELDLAVARVSAISTSKGLSGFPCVAGHNGQQGVPLCHDAKNLPYRMSFSISFWRAALPVPPSSRAVCSIR